MSFDSIDVVRPSEVTGEDRAAWLTCFEREAVYRTGFLHPDYATLVGEVRSDARVAIVRDAGEPIGFLGFHARPDGFGRPLGAPFSDVHGLVRATDAPLDIGRVLRRIGLNGFRATGWVEPEGGATLSRLHLNYAHQVVFEADDAGVEASSSVLEAKAKQHPKHFKSTRRLRRRALEEGGPLRFEFDLRDPDRLERLLSWKSAQLSATGRHDVLAPEWARDLLHRLAADPDAAVRLQVSRLSAGDTPIAYEANLRCGPTLHGWLVAYHPEWSKFSPGLLLMQDIIEAAPADGVRVYDLGPDGDHYKRFYANAQAVSGDGVIGAAGFVGGLRAASSQLARSFEAKAPARIGVLAGRARRRADQIAVSELTWAGRLRGAAQALRQGPSRPRAIRQV